MAEPAILDLDELKPVPRFFVITEAGGEKLKVDVSRIPFVVTLTIMQNLEKFQQIEDGTVDDSTWMLLMEIVLKTINVTKPKIDESWIKANLDLVQCIALIMFVLDPVVKRINTTKLGQKKK